MATHILTTKQLQKFVDVVKALGPSDRPVLTDDPKVNFVVDCFIALIDSQDEPLYDEHQYTAEVEALRITAPST